MAAVAASHARPVLSSRISQRLQTCRRALPIAFRGVGHRSMSAPARRRTPAVAAASGPAVAAAAAAGDVQGAMLDAPSPANKNWVRLLAVSATVAAAARGTALLPSSGIAFVHLLAYSTWLGSLVWTTFVAGITMFKNLPRQTFGKLQSKLFPLYFGLSAACTAIQLGVLVFAAQAAPQKEVVLLGVGLATSLLNLLVAEPIATDVMFQRYALENAPSRDNAAIKSLAKQFGKWHGISSLINLGTLVAAIGHGWWLASQMLGVLA